MLTRGRLTAGWLCVVVLFLTMSSQAWATPMALFTVDDLGGGLFQYNLIVDNTGGSEPLSGLNVLKGNSVFGLDDSSVMGAPEDVSGNPAADWSFFAPFPPFIDELNYFSLDPGADVPMDGFLGGFSFRSTTNPTTISGDDFAVEGIGAITASQISMGNAVLVPEPSSLFLLASGLAGVFFSGRKKLREVFG